MAATVGVTRARSHASRTTDPRVDPTSPPLPPARPVVPAVVPPRATRTSSSRAGMTLLELIVVLALLATISALTAPKTLALLRSARTASARRQLGAVAEAARAGAIQRQRPGKVEIAATAGGNGATLTASVDTGGGQPYIVLRQTVAVPVAARDAGDQVVAYDARGLLTPRRSKPVIYLLGAAGGARDSVCLSAYGHVLPRGCAL